MGVFEISGKAEQTGIYGEYSKVMRVPMRDSIQGIRGEALILHSKPLALNPKLTDYACGLHSILTIFFQIATGRMLWGISCHNYTGVARNPVEPDNGSGFHILFAAAWTQICF